MHFLRRAKKTISKCAAMFILIPAVTVTAPAFTAGAADTGAVTAGETEDAVTGHVYVRAAVEKGYEADIVVCLIPESEKGAVHEYRLHPGNRYGLSDDIAEGSYTCVPFIKDPDQGASVFVEYGGGEKEVSQHEDACFLVVAGSAGFVWDYIWISDYRDEKGECLKGVVSRLEAEEAFKKTIAFQEELPGRDNAAGEDPEEVEGPLAPGQLSEVPVPEAGDGQGRVRNMPFAAAVAAVAAFPAGCAAAVYHIRKKRRSPAIAEGTDAERI